MAQITVDNIASIVHETLRAYAIAIGEDQMPNWQDCPDWMKESTITSVKFVLDNPDAKEGAQHDQWVRQKIEAGWVFGEEKDEARKTHPSLISFRSLSEKEKRKDRLVIAVVKTFID